MKKQFEIIQQWKDREPSISEINKTTQLLSSERIDLLREKPQQCCTNPRFLDLKSPSWTSLTYCENCTKLIFTFYVDRMSGTHEDIVEIRTINGNSN